MSDSFIYCEKCGTRNFADDSHCGICKAVLLTPEIGNELEKNLSQIQNEKIKNFFAWTILAVIVIVAYYNISDKERPAADDTAVTVSPVNSSLISSYRLVETNLNNRRAFNFTVLINEKLSNPSLLEIAKTIKVSQNTVSQKGVVFFKLPEMDPDGAAWARVTFDPRPKVQILGSTSTEDEKMKNAIPLATDYIGLWLDRSTGNDIVTKIRLDKELGYVIQFLDPDNVDQKSDWAIPLKKIKRNGKVVFMDLERTDQYYVIETNGDLSSYDKEGFIATYKKIK